MVNMTSNVWQILTIEPTSDLKTIKRAYASRLKVVRPDDDPIAFQQLHQSYKQAQVIARQMSAQDDLEQPNVGSGSTTYGGHEFADNAAIEQASTASPIAEVSVNPPVDVTTTNADQQYLDMMAQAEQEKQLWEQEKQRLLEQFHLVLASAGARNRLQAYDFFQQSPYILNIDFRINLGYAVFSALAEYEQALKLKNRGRTRAGRSKGKQNENIRPSVLKGLNSIFHWGDQQADLLFLVRTKVAEKLLHRIASTVELPDELSGVRGSAQISRYQAVEYTEMDISSVFRRLFGFAIDTVLFFVLLVLSEHLFGDSSQNGLTLISNGLFLTGFCTIYYCYFWLMDYFKGGTFGKLLLGMLVVNSNFEKLTLMRAFFRTLAFVLCSIGGKFTIFINAWIGPKCIQDRLSQTLVINRADNYH